MITYRFAAAASAALLLLAPAAPLAAQGERVRITEPEAGQLTSVRSNAELVTSYNAVRSTRPAGRVLAESMNRKIFHVRYRTKIDTGTKLLPDTGEWFCTDRDNYYTGGGRHSKVCFSDSDGDGRFERLRLGRGLLKKKLDPPVEWGELQEKTDIKSTRGLRKSLVFRGFQNDMLSLDYIEYVGSRSDPSVRRSVDIALPGGSGWVEVEGLRLAVEKADATSIEYRLVSGSL